jgi:hypothetical protein
MLPQSLIHEIDRLLKQRRLSHRKIAARVGVSRGTVSAIASGRRGLHGKDLREAEFRSLVPIAPAARCCRCGYRVYLPCLICAARQHKNQPKNGDSRSVE